MNIDVGMYVSRYHLYRQVVRSNLCLCDVSRIEWLRQMYIHIDNTAAWQILLASSTEQLWYVVLYV